MKSSTKTTDLYFPEKDLKKAVDVYRAINHKLRQQILDLIHQHGRIMVARIYESLLRDQSSTSQNLAILRKARIVKTTREGKCIFYSVNYERLKEIHALSAKMMQPVST